MHHIILKLSLIYESILVNKSSEDLPLIPNPPPFIDTINNYDSLFALFFLLDLFDKDTPAMLNASVFFDIAFVSSIDNVELNSFQLPVISIHFDELFLMFFVRKIKWILISILLNEDVFGFHIKLFERELYIANNLRWGIFDLFLLIFISLILVFIHILIEFLIACQASLALSLCRFLIFMALINFQ
jgi:hypothetical protein